MFIQAHFWKVLGIMKKFDRSKLKLVAGFFGGRVVGNESFYFLWKDVIAGFRYESEGNEQVSQHTKIFLRIN